MRDYEPSQPFHIAVFPGIFQSKYYGDPLDTKLLIKLFRYWPFYVFMDQEAVESINIHIIHNIQ